MRRNLMLVSACLVSVSASAASADLIGSTATLDSFFPNLASNVGSWGPAVVIDPGVEFTDVFGVNLWEGDAGDTWVQLEHFAAGNLIGPADFNGFVFTFTGLVDSIDSVSLDAGSTLIPTEFWVTGNQVFIDYEGAGIIGPSYTRLNLTFIPAPGSAAVIGLGALAFGRRRRSAAS